MVEAKEPSALEVELARKSDSEPVLSRPLHTRGGGAGGGAEEGLRSEHCAGCESVPRVERPLIYAFQQIRRVEFAHVPVDN